MKSFFRVMKALSERNMIKITKFLEKKTLRLRAFILVALMAIHDRINCGILALFFLIPSVLWGGKSWFYGNSKVRSSG